ncbi:MAG: zincin-like metallopeptidase domain-containing protein [Marivita sp.]|uniref:ArdC family protein n=1 Tax=Marivita sp. TaxID=2003365 RepID=UPI0025C63E85|nr:zincin-like metallopeptidase domain-containing protein [Marivita sp.]MCI5111611.1 zincin-like metallopeptidase domain-containing protein [Marivita sp.]
MAKEKFDIQQHVTNAIIKAIEDGVAPWRQPWTGGSGAVFPLRANGEQYRGINTLMLWMTAQQKGFEAAHWFTFKQAKEKGGAVRKGEKSTLVVFYNTHETEDRVTGEEIKVPYLRGYRVFNADQIDGLPDEYYQTAAAEAHDFGTLTNPILEAFFAETGAKIETTEQPKAFYHHSRDVIHMPPVSTFFDADSYYATLAHETIHWTGHKSRLDRLGNGRDREEYAKEELVAEIGACILCATIGLTPDFEQSGTYIDGWLNALRNDKRYIFRAASAAQKAVDFITVAQDAIQQIAA